MTHQNTETLKQWFAEQVEFAKSTVEYWQELATIARGEVVALQARVKELKKQLWDLADKYEKAEIKCCLRQCSFLIAAEARVKELESQLYSTRVTDVMNLRARIAELEARDKVKAEEYDTRIMLANHLEIERDELTKRIAELERERCEHCGATLNVSGCVLCGAPICCPQCCRLQSLADHIEKLQARVQELEARTSDKDSASGKAETT